MLRMPNPHCTHVSSCPQGRPLQYLRSRVPHAVRSTPVPKKSIHIWHTRCRETHQRCTSVPTYFPTHVLGDLGESRWKPAQTHLQAISGLESWNTHRHSECARLFQCSSSGSDWAASKGGQRWAWQPAGSNRTVARIRSAPPDQIRLVGGPSAGGSTSQHRSRSRPTKLWLHTHPSTAT